MFNVWYGRNVCVVKVSHHMCNPRGGGTDGADGRQSVYVEAAQVCHIQHMESFTAMLSSIEINGFIEGEEEE